MADNQLLFYEQAVPISAQQHATLCVQRAGFAFSRATNSAPLTMVEFAKACREYPIVFGGGEEQPTFPLAILGLKDRENLFIGDDGGWQAQYIPAFVRRYPFVFATQDDGQTFTVCIDEGFAGCNNDAQGERLFDDEGEQTSYLQNMVTFLQQYQVEYQRTRSVSERLDELGILEPMQANVALKSGDKISLAGFRVVSRERLKALTGDQLETLLERDELEFIYAHLLSLESFGAMVDRLAQKSE